MIEQYLNQCESHNYKRLAKRAWALWSSNVGNPCQPSIQDAEAYKLRRVGQGISLNTIKTEISTLKAIYSYLNRIEPTTIPNNPFTSIYFKRRTAQPLKRASALPDWAVRRLIKQASTMSPYNYMYVALSFGTGWRISEVLALQWHQVLLDVEVPYLTQVQTKNHLQRNQPIPPWLVDILRKHRQLDGKVIPFSQTYARNLWHFLIDSIKAELPAGGSYTPHSARVTAISKLLTDGFSIVSLQDFSGHLSTKSVENYNRRIQQLENNPGRKIGY